MGEQLSTTSPLQIAIDASALRKEVTMLDDEREPTWWERNGYKVTVFGFLVLMFGLLPLLISGR
jgi:hypothetical protein